jgi:hypothetical protein
MLHLSTTAPTDPQSQPFPIIRVGATRPLVVIITCENTLGCYTHFWGGRTVPCTDPTCDACNAGCPRRWHIYLTVYSEPEQLHSLLELTAAAGENIYRYATEHGTVRACCIEATRRPKTSNGRIIIRTKMTDPARNPIPAAPDVPYLLSRLWNIPLTDITASTNGHAKTILETRATTELEELNRRIPQWQR